MTGWTSSTDFPVQNFYQGTYSGGANDAFITRIDTTKSGVASLICSTYLGGSGQDQGYGIAVDKSSHSYVTGITDSANFPTRNPYQGDQGGGDAFITKLAPTNIIVNPDTGQTFTSVQAALNAATPGQSLVVYPGTYTENITLTAGVAIYGYGADWTTLQGTGAGPTVKAEGGGIGPSTVISGFRITSGSSSGGMSAQTSGVAAYINKASPSIRNNVIEGNTATAGGGIYVDNGDPIISNNTIQSNNANSGGGIYVNSGNPTISNNTLQDNNANVGGGIYIGGGSSTISNNTIQGNNSNANGGGIYIGGGNPIVSNNVIQGNSALAGGGIYVDEAANPSIHSNTLCDNTEFNLYKNGDGILDAPGNWWGANTPVSGTDYNAYVNPDPVIKASMEAVSQDSGGSVSSTVKILRWATVTVTLRSGDYHAADGTVIGLTIQNEEGYFEDNSSSAVVSTTNGLVSAQITPLTVKQIEVLAFSGCNGQQVGSVTITGEPAEVNLPIIVKPTSQ